MLRIVVVIIFLLNINVIKAENATYKYVHSGNDDALFKLYVFGSLSCGACANFHTQLNKLENTIVKDNILEIVYVPFTINKDIDRIAHAILTAAPNNRTGLKFMDAIYVNQSKIFNKNDIITTIKNYALLSGISAVEIQNAINNNSLSKWLDNQDSMSRELGIDATPTMFLIRKNGDIKNPIRKYRGSTSSDQLEDDIKSFLN